jgi:F-type H+-transporting ATPase subunit gamma
MPNVEDLKRRLDSIRDLQSVAKTMKALAAVNIRQYERAVAALGEYTRTVELGLQIVLRDRPGLGIAAKLAPLDRLGAVIFGSDQGMCGQFNEHIVTFALDTMNGMQVRHRDRSILAVGAQATSRLHAARQNVEAEYLLPGSADGIASSIQHLLVDIERWRTEREIDRIVMFYNKPLPDASYQPQMVHLLPLSSAWLRDLEERSWPTRVLPMHSMGWRRLFSALLRQFFIVSLHMAFSLSLAAENASRLAAMQAAEKNVEERLEELSKQYNRLRQRAITEELLDISAGFEALSSS